ncbi:hypothetical protein TIFTF001_029953 [Ficus carica]|uniref:Uncharacterized protein n=1 Tax=Ficus carica TaxID=3494 RepID=A0AA88DSB4_FICCA|nr:hypothetical protein TIFTF001_029953 [Ficus carica]
MFSGFVWYFPGGRDIYFDNGEAEMLEAVVANMNNYGRIAACGVIAYRFQQSSCPGYT